MSARPAPASDKTRVRAWARARRRELSRAQREDPAVLDAAELAIARTVLGLVAGLGLGRPARVAAYLSLPVEPPTGALVDALTERGHEVIVPVTLPDFDLDWRRPEPGERAVAATTARRAVTAADGTLGVEAVAGCDLVVVPALLVDADGHRLGQGGGCYDRALSRLPGGPAPAGLPSGREAGRPLVVALLHPAELLPQVANAPFPPECFTPPAAPQIANAPLPPDCFSGSETSAGGAFPRERSVSDLGGAGNGTGWGVDPHDRAVDAVVTTDGRLSWCRRPE